MDADVHVGGEPGPEQIDLAVGVFRMLADPTRVRLLWALAQGERTVSDLAERVQKPAPSVSQHLAKLRMAHLVLTRRDGVQIHYRVANAHIAHLVTDALDNAEHALSPQPTHHRTALGARASGASS